MKILYVINKKDTREHILKFHEFIEKEFPKLLTEKNPELILCTGGDGTFLKVLAKWGKKKIPVLGRAAGTVNFLLNDFNNRDKEIIEALLKDKIKLDFLKASSIKIFLNDEKIKKVSVNDVAIGNNIMDSQKFIINTEDQYLKNLSVSGLGICIATPVGSTGFNLNNKGKILKINDRKNKYSSLWSFTSVVANAKINDVLFEQEINIDILTERHSCFLYIDGQPYKTPLKMNDRITLKKGKKYLMAFLDKEIFINKRIDLHNRKT